MSATLPEPVNHALEQTRALGEQKIGEIMGTRQPQEPAPPTVSTGAGEGKVAQTEGDVLGGAWTLGESKIGELIGTRQAPARQPTDEGGGVERAGGSESPPPGNR